MQREIALTVDLEGSLSKLPSRLDLLLDLFARNSVKATFFILGELAEGAPEIVRKISRAGHEIGFHGYQHVPISDLNRNQLVSQLTDWRHRLEGFAQQKVEGFRAPYFSIARSTAWALDAISTAGFVYDSSIYPGISDRFSWPSAPKFPVRLKGVKLVEFPVPILSAVLPIGFSGGGYLRLLPWLLVSWGFHQQFRRGSPGMIYVHPWEIDVTPDNENPKPHLNGTRGWSRWRESVPGKWRRRQMRDRLEHLVTTHRDRLAPMREVIASLTELPLWNDV
jgi:polysaccharide deacetylase family protein (PEP-CTERM system associated)